MTKQTMQQQHVEALKARGATEVVGGSSKAVLMLLRVASSKEPGKFNDAFFWCGTSGAVRFNTVKRFDGSRSMSDMWKARLRAEVQ